MTTFHVQAFDARSYTRADLEDMEIDLTALWAGWPFPARWIMQMVPLDVTPRRDELRVQLAPLNDVRGLLPFMEAVRTTPTPATWHSLTSYLEWRSESLVEVLDPVLLGRVQAAPATALDALDTACRKVLWRWKWLKEQQVELEQQARHRPPLVANHFLLTWAGKMMPAAVIRDHLLRRTLVPSVVEAPLPPLWQGRFRPHPTYLEPLVPGDPYMTVLTAWEARGDWDLLSWLPLLMSNIELTLAIDVQHSAQGEAQLERIKKSFRALRSGGESDNRSDRAASDVEQALAVIDTQSLHEIQYAVLLKDRTAELLEEKVAKVSKLLGRGLQFEQVEGAQRAYLQLFTDTPAQRITAPQTRWNTLSQGVGAKTPVGMRRGSAMRGVCYGIDAMTNLPVHHRSFGEDGQRNDSALILGLPGGGKTKSSMLAQGTRHAAEGAQVIMAEPTGQLWRVLEAVGNDRAVAYYDLSRTPAINMLDPISTEPGVQSAQLLRKLEMALGRSENIGGRAKVELLRLLPKQRGLIDRALLHDSLYGPKCHKLADLTPKTAPRVEQLVAVLYAMGRDESRPEATELAEMLDHNLLGTKEAIYNRPTELQINFDADIILLQFNAEAENELRPLVYDWLFELVNRHVWSPTRDIWRRPLYLYLDEFYYMSSVRDLELYAARAIKTWRNRRAAFRAIDQSIEAFYGVAGNAEEAAALIVGAVAHRFFYQLKGKALNILREAHDDVLSLQLLRQIPRLDIGQCVALLDNAVYTLNVELSPREYQYFVAQQQPQERVAA